MTSNGEGSRPPPAVDDSPDLVRSSLALFDELVDRDPQMRRRELDLLARRDPALHRRVRRLLESADRADSAKFLGGPRPLDDEVPMMEQDESGLRRDDRIGVYELDRPIGRGGMGEVWLARRADGVHDAAVALKVLHRHLSAGTSRDRFIREGRILGSLDHPNIARLLDAGVTSQGQQYLVIEYVDGKPVDRWCDEQCLTIEARLRLFLQICTAVSFAHSHLIVHRDLKPSNILVTADGKVKLLDFGIAKLLETDQSGAEATELTRVGGGMLTPQYAAPEQLLGEPITMATDVYALGILLYRLLTGRHPYGHAGRSAAQLAFDVIQSEPRAASDIAVKPTQAGVGADEVAAMRASTPRLLARQLRGDLDAIVGKALRKEKGSRYPDARALAGDVERHLRHEPVRARAGARLYVWTRFLRRNWMALSVVAAFVGLLFVGLGLVLWQSHQTQREARRAAAVTDFLVSVFSASDPRVAQDQPRIDVTARELLDRSARRITGEFASDPDTEIRLLSITADIYRELDDRAHYESLHAEQMTLARSRYGEASSEYVGGLLTEVTEAESRGDYVEAQKRLETAAPLIHRAGLDHSALQAQWLLLKGQAYVMDDTRWPLRESLLKQSVQLYALVAPRDSGYFRALAGLGDLGYDRGDYASAERDYLSAIAAAENAAPRNDAELLDVYEYLALTYHYNGELDLAEQTYNRATALALATYGERHRRYWRVVADHARLVHERGDRDRAMAMFAHLQTLMPDPGTDINVDVGEVLYNHAACLVEEGQPWTAIPVLETIAKAYQSNPSASYAEPRVLAMLGEALSQVGRGLEAIRNLKAALDLYLADPQSDPDSILDVRQRYGQALVSEGDLEEAREQFQDVLAKTRGRPKDSTVMAHAGMARLLLREGNASGALAAVQNGLEALDHVNGLTDARDAPALWQIRAEGMFAAGDDGAARSWAQRALGAERHFDGENSIQVAATTMLLQRIDHRSASAVPSPSTEHSR